MVEHVLEWMPVVSSMLRKTEIPSDNNKQEYDNNVNTNEIFDVNGDNDVVFDEIKQLNDTL